LNRWYHFEQPPMFRRLLFHSWRALGAHMETETALRGKVVFWKRTAIAIGAAAIALCLVGMQASGKKIIGVSGGDSYIYRVYDDGSIDFIQADNQIKTVRGIPNWQEIPIDRTLIRQQR